ncbi:hypothetical protein HK096_001159 [Nowakowskiella sp. JEL0078]|nr:hypothetical protein HK096_001159 [Nowakowskiella sp. JEL0078]
MFTGGVNREYVSYDTTLEQSREFLVNHGVAAFPGILSQVECENLRYSIWDNMKTITNGAFDFYEKSTWPNYYSILQPECSMLLHHYSIGHIQPLWDIRQNENVVNAFAKVWGKTQPRDMITSFDGLSIFLPILGKKLEQGELHVDQGAQSRGFKCYQGLIPLYDINPGDGTLSVLENSHLYHDEYFDGKVKLESDYVEISDLWFYRKKGCRQTFVKASAGSLILWDSRTVHMGALPVTDNLRMVMYVCMIPRDMATQEQLDNRISAFDSLKTSTHTPIPVNWFNLLPSVKIGTVPKPLLTPLGRCLVGFKE